MSQLTQMSQLTVAIVVGHGNRGDRDDPGVTHDLDGDGVVEVSTESEARVLRDLLVGVIRYGLASEGATVHVIDAGPYTERHATARKIAEASSLCAILHAHIDAGSASSSRPLIGYWKASAEGRELAEQVATGWGMHAPAWMRPEQPWMRAYVGDEEEQWARNGAALLYETWRTPRWCTGVLLEPFHLAVLAGKPWYDRAVALIQVAQGVVVGVDRWAAWAVTNKIART